MGGSTTIEFFFQKSFVGSFLLLSNKQIRLSSKQRGQIHTRKPHFLSECTRPHEIALSSETLGQTARDRLRPCMPQQHLYNCSGRRLVQIGLVPGLVSGGQPSMFHSFPTSLEIVTSLRSLNTRSSFYKSLIFPKFCSVGSVQAPN